MSERVYPVGFVTLHKGKAIRLVQGTDGCEGCMAQTQDECHELPSCNLDYNQDQVWQEATD